MLRRPKDQTCQCGAPIEHEMALVDHQGTHLWYTMQARLHAARGERWCDRVTRQAMASKCRRHDAHKLACDARARPQVYREQAAMEINTNTCLEPHLATNAYRPHRSPWAHRPGIVSSTSGQCQERQDCRDLEGVKRIEPCPLLHMQSHNRCAHMRTRRIDAQARSHNGGVDATPMQSVVFPYIEFVEQARGLPTKARLVSQQAPLLPPARHILKRFARSGEFQ